MGLARSLCIFRANSPAMATRDSSIVLPWGGAGHSLQRGTIGGGGADSETLSSLLLVVAGAMDINTYHGCGRATDTDMAPGSSLGPFDTLVLSGIICYSGLYGSGSSTALGHQDNHKWRPRSWESVWFLAATQATIHQHRFRLW